jgi:hypothetical protein
MNAFHSALLTAALLGTFATTACTAEQEEADSTEGAATAGGGADCDPAALADEELRLAPINSSVTCTDVASGSSDRSIVEAKCRTYADREIFRPEAGHIAVECLRQAKDGAGVTANEAKQCGLRGLRSLCRTEASNGWCTTVVAGVTAQRGHENDNAGGGLTQKCRWVAPGLAAGGRVAVDLCIGDKSNFTSFDACLNTLGAITSR